MIKNLCRTIIIFLLFSTSNIFSQKSPSNSRFEDEYNTWSIGAGFSMFNMHGDLRSFDTYSGEAYYNFGGYISGQKMFNPIVGAELKFNISQIGGEVQTLYTSGDPLTQTYYAILYADEFSNEILYFDGMAYGLEGNMIINLSNIWKLRERKWSWSFYLGAGYHRYNSRLKIKNFKGYTGKDGYVEDKVSPDGVVKDADFGYNDSRDNKNAAGSLYMNLGLGVKYKLSPKFDIQGRVNLGINNEDHLDAAISQKQVFESFITPNIGVIYNLGTKSKSAVWAIEDSRSYSNNNYTRLAVVDSDKDGIPDHVDKDNNTPKGVQVYSNGIAVDSDKDNVPDYLDKCPLEKGSVTNKGCPFETTPVSVATAEDCIEGVVGASNCKKSTNNIKPAAQQVTLDSIYKKEVIAEVNAEKVANSKQSTVSKSDKEVAIKRMFDKIKFSRSESNRLKTANIEIIHLASQMILDYDAEAKFVIEIHTDDKPNKVYNKEISKRRAFAIKQQLLKNGVAKERFEVIGMGAERMKYNRDIKEENVKNNRIEVQVK